VVDAYRGYLSSWVPQFVVSLARLQPVRGRHTRVKHITDLTGLDEAFRHSWYQSKAVVMADRRDWGGGGDDPEESTQRMIEKIWESLTDIWMRMDQQAPVPPVIGEAVPVAPVPPPPWVEVPFVAPVPPSPPVIAAEEPVVQQAKREQFRTLQQGETSVLEYQMRFMALSRIVEEVAQRAATLERALQTRQVDESALRAAGVGKATLRSVVTWSRHHDASRYKPLQGVREKQGKRQEIAT
ncbi:hypothetical protein Taro_011758, partial [Colocasia esculenta]|nr:hypothetical protein [Colocasia esculenta]